MVARALLVLLLLVPGLTAVAGQSQVKCLSCHPVHYNDRACTACHRGNPATDREYIAHHRLIRGRFASFLQTDSSAVASGNRLLERLGCRRCHVTGNSGNRLAVSLDSASRVTAADDLAAGLASPALGMPDFRLTGDQIAALVTAILAHGAAVETRPEERPVTVHFQGKEGEGKDLFSTRCGGCHRMLSPTLGLLGTGTVGPNLSGLMTRYYPGTFDGRNRFDWDRLQQWLKNPRRVRPHSLMPPVVLNGGEMLPLRKVLMLE